MIARAFASHQAGLEGVCIYAAGVSNSSCVDPFEFERERARISDTLGSLHNDHLFVYVSTCSIDDPSGSHSAYIRHKSAMEDLARQRPRHLIIRLPQVAGRSPNPHTLLNFLYTRISRSERFVVWNGASRNIIDVADAARIAVDLIKVESPAGETINVANTLNTPSLEIVRLMEEVLKRKAIYQLANKGSDYPISTARTHAALKRCGIGFDEAYLPRVIAKYYAGRASL